MTKCHTTGTQVPPLGQHAGLDDPAAHLLPGTMAAFSLSYAWYSSRRSTLFILISSSVLCRTVQFISDTRFMALVSARPASPESRTTSDTNTAVRRTRLCPIISRRMDSQRLTTCAHTDSTQHVGKLGSTCRTCEQQCLQWSTSSPLEECVVVCGVQCGSGSYAYSAPARGGQVLGTGVCGGSSGINTTSTYTWRSCN